MKCVDCGAPGRAFQSTRCGACTRSRRNSQARDRYAKDLDASRAYARNRRAANAETLKRSYAKWRRTHLEQERERLRRAYWADPEAARARAKAWADANPGYSARRYAQNPASKKASQFKRRAAGAVKPSDLRELRATNAHCAYCFKPAADTVDHVVPISRGGANTPDNLVLACFSCNAGKRDRTPLEYLLNWGRNV